MRGDDPKIDTAQTPKRFDRRLAREEKIQKTLADSIPNKTGAVNHKLFHYRCCDSCKLAKHSAILGKHREKTKNGGEKYNTPFLTV